YESRTPGRRGHAWRSATLRRAQVPTPGGRAGPLLLGGVGTALGLANVGALVYLAVYLCRRFEVNLGSFFPRQHQCRRANALDRGEPWLVVPSRRLGVPEQSAN